MKYFELVISNTTPKNFAEDLASNIANLPPGGIILGKETALEQVEIKNTQIIPPDENSPHYKLEIHAHTFRVSPESAGHLRIRAVLGFGRNLGSVISAELRAMTDAQIRFTGTCEDYMANYMSLWLRQVVATYGARPVDWIIGVDSSNIIRPAGLNNDPLVSKKVDVEENVSSLSKAAITSQGNVTVGNDFVGRDKITNITFQSLLADSGAGTKEKSFFIGDKLKTVRDEIGLQSSEFIELIGFHSEQQYLQMENNEEECPESVISQVCEATGVLPEWLKHSGQRKYEVEPYLDWVKNPDQTVQQIANLSTGLVYVTITASTPKDNFLLWPIKNAWGKSRSKYLHIGLCVQTAKYKYKVFESSFCADFRNEHLRSKYAPSFLSFLQGLFGHFDLDCHGIILTNWKDDEDLYNGRVHPRKILVKNKSAHNIRWVYAVLKEEHSDYERRYYSQYGRWIGEIQALFNELNRTRDAKQ